MTSCDRGDKKGQEWKNVTSVTSVSKNEHEQRKKHDKFEKYDKKIGKIWQCVKWGKPDKSNKHEDCDKTWLVWQNMTSVNNSPSVTKYDKCN